MLAMSDEQKAVSLGAIARAVQHFHTQAGLGMALGQHQSFISRLANGTAELDAVVAMQIEKATKGAVKRHELRPDLWDPPLEKYQRTLKQWSDMPQKMRDTIRLGIGLKPGDHVTISGTKSFDGERVIGATLDELPPPMKGQHDGKTRSGKRQKGEAEKETGGRARTQGRQRPQTKGGGK